MLGCVALKAPNMFAHRVQEEVMAAGLSEVWTTEGRGGRAREREILLTKRGRAPFNWQAPSTLKRARQRGCTCLLRASAILTRPDPPSCFLSGKK